MANQTAQEHFNRAITSARLDTAIEEFDACICANPSRSLALLAYFHLAKAINRKFGFEHREDEVISDEEFSWRLQEVFCMSKVFDLYDEIPESEKTPQIREARGEVQYSFDDVSYIQYGLVYTDPDGEERTRDLNEVFDEITLLNCLKGQNLLLPVHEQVLEMHENLRPFREAGQEIDRKMEIHESLRAITSAYDNEPIKVTKWSDKVAEYVSDSSVRKVGSFAFGNSKVVDETRRWAARKDAVVMVVRTEDGYDLYAVTEETAKKTGGCFIATAAYGSALASEVIVLSRFRDEFMLKWRLGALLVSFYYLVSPPLATFITKATLLRAMTRVLLLAPILGLLKVLKFRY